MSAKEHYDNHLGNFYGWMVGDISGKITDFKDFLVDHGLVAMHEEVAVDLGAGNGIQSIALAQCGYHVIAIDFNAQLLDELSKNASNLKVTMVNDDLRNVGQHAHNAAVVCCCGDTITHLESAEHIEQLLTEIYKALKPLGRAIFSFRDYSMTLEGVQRFIPVKSDENRILTCVLEFESEAVNVTDLLYERRGGAWSQSVSSYKKVRLKRSAFVEMLKRAGFKVALNDIVNRLITVIAIK